MPSGWSGYPTGRIPLSLLTMLRSDMGASGYAQPDAARAFLAMSREYAAKFGKPMPFSEFYRTWDRQNYYYQGWVQRLPGFNPAAAPDRGKHEEALAVDLAGPLTSWTTPEQAWFRQNEARFGFSSAQGIADGEPWHKVYIGPTPTVSGGGATPIIERTDDDEMISPEGMAQLRELVQTEVNNAVALLTVRGQRENRGRLYYCETPPAGLPQFVVIWPNRNPGDKAIIYANDGETQAAHWRDMYLQTADTVQQAKAAKVDAGTFQKLVDFAEGRDSAFINERDQK